MTLAVPPESEKQFMASVLTLARVLGWLCFHTHDSRRSESGFPDLFMVRGTRAVAAELKSERGKLSAAQQKWLERMGAAGLEVYTWKPTQKQEIAGILK